MPLHLTLSQQALLDQLKMATPSASTHELFQLLESGSHVPLERVKGLMRRGANPSTQFGDNSSSALFLCAERNDEALLHLLLTQCRWKNMNQMGRLNGGGLSVLMLAARLGHNDCVSLLLSSGCSTPEVVNQKAGPKHLQCTPLLLACAEDHTDVARALLESGADPNLCDSRGRSPVHLAATRGNLELVEELESHGASVTTVDLQGNTAMHFCTHPPILEHLYHHGVSPTARNKRGSTALDTLRRMHADPDTVAFLQRLQERERWWQDVERMSLRQRLLHYLKWQMENIVRDLGWRTVLLVQIT